MAWDKNQSLVGAPSNCRAHLPYNGKIANLATSQKPVKLESWFLAKGRKSTTFLSLRNENFHSKSALKKVISRAIQGQ